MTTKDLEAMTTPAPTTSDRRECLISDLSGTTPAAAISDTPAPNRWILIPYEAEGFDGVMLYRHMRSYPADVAVRLPDLGSCRIYVGLYGSGEAPVWLHHHYGRQRGPQLWKRLCLRLSDEPYFDFIVPDPFPEAPDHQYISESLWKTADVTGRSLVFAAPKQEAFLDTESCVAYIRLVPVADAPSWPRDTKRLINYFDGNFLGHFVADVADVQTQIAPLAESDCGTIFWTTCREDTCYYPTKVGNTLPWHEMPGAYPHWAGRDLQCLLAKGEDPLAAACTVAHEAGIRIFASYRRMTCRLPPHVSPLHPKAMLITRRDLWCADEHGAPVPQLSLAYPEVRRRMASLVAEQAQRYDINGVHLFFCRGVPFVLFETPFLEAFSREFVDDPRELAPDDERVWAVRAQFVLTYLRELRSALDETGRTRNRRFEIAITLMNRPRTCAYFGLDVPAMVKEGLVDLLVPFPSHYLPDHMGESRVTPETVAEFAAITRGTSVRLYPAIYRGWADDLPIEERAAALYEAGADGLQVFQTGVRGHGSKQFDAVHRRLGHIDELHAAPTWWREAARAVRIKTVAGFRLDRLRGLHTCG